MKCRYVYDKEAGKVHIPGCWGSAINGPDFCTCFLEKEATEVSDKMKLIRELENENARLSRMIKKLLKALQHSNKKAMNYKPTGLTEKENQKRV